jgi:hypothetical protein
MKSSLAAPPVGDKPRVHAMLWRRATNKPIGSFRSKKEWVTFNNFFRIFAVGKNDANI